MVLWRSVNSWVVASGCHIGLRSLVLSLVHECFLPWPSLALDLRLKFYRSLYERDVDKHGSRSENELVMFAWVSTQKQFGWFESTTLPSQGQPWSTLSRTTWVSAPDDLLHLEA